VPDSRRLVLAAALLCLHAFPARAVDLVPGYPQEILIPPQTEPTLLGGLSFVVPPGSSWAVVELSVEAADHDVDLYLRFERAVTRSVGGQVQADYSSAEPAGEDEKIFFTGASSPPLQTGRYYVGLLVQSTDVEIRAKIRLSLQSGAPPQAFITTTFDVDDEGWKPNFPPSPLPGASVGDSGAAVAFDPAGFMRIQDPGGSNREYAVAPAKFLGDLASFSNAKLTYDLRQADGAQPVFRTEVRILGAGSVYTWSGNPPPQGEWTTVTVPIEARRWTRSSGSASFEETLRNVVRIEIAMEHAGGPEVTDLDNIVFSGGPPAPPSGGGGPTSSDFENGLDGWSHNYPASALPGAGVGTPAASVSTGFGGKESNRYLLAVDGGGRDADWLVAPSKFITGLASLDRPWYEFWYRHIDGASAFFRVRMRLYGSGSIYEWSGQRARQDWMRFRAPLDRAYWLRIYGSAEFDSVVRNAQRLELSMDNAAGPEANGLDDFYLRLEYSPPEGRALQLDPAEVSVEVPRGEGPVEREIGIVATGGNLFWSAAIRPADTSWLRLSRNFGGTPDAVTATFDTAKLGPAVYRADIIVTPADFLAPAKTIPVTLIVGPDPRAPTLAQAGAVHAADALVPLSPGALGSLYGEFLADGELITSFESGAERLPTAALGTSVRFETADETLLALAPLLYLNPGQINFQAPYELMGHTTVFVSVERGGARGNRIPVAVSAAGPGIFTSPGGLATIVNQNGALNAADAAAATGEYATVYFSGTGQVDPPIASGQAAPNAPLHVPSGELTATVDGVEARVLGAALSPGFVGLAQLSFEVPAGLGPGQHVLGIGIAGRQSNSVRFWTE
jgi:uncharacterized protein (TIGR03437 family)